MDNISILKRLYNDYTKRYLDKILLSVFFSVLLAGSTSAVAYLLDPAINKLFIEKDQTLLYVIPILIVIAFAVKGFAERINGTVNSSTTVDIQNDTRKDRTYVEHMVKDTTIREHLEVKKYSYELAATSRVHTYVRIKMPLETFDRLIAEAKVQ